MSTNPTIPTELVARQFARLEKVEDALANGAHFADDAKCHPLYPVAVAARQILKAHIEALEAALRDRDEQIDMALKCTPSIRDGVIIYDCGDPWQILRQALTNRKV